MTIGVWDKGEGGEGRGEALANMPRLDNMPDTVAFFTSHCCTDKTFKMGRAFYTVISPIRPSWHYILQHTESRLTCLRHVWLLNGLEWNWLASPLKASRWTIAVCQNQLTPTTGFPLDKVDQIMLMKFVWHHRIQHTHQFAWWSFQYWLIIITVFHPRLWLCDSMTKAARTKCQRILCKQNKAFELMQWGTEGNPHPNLPAFIQSLLKVHLLPTVGASFFPLSFGLFFPSLTTKMKQINPSPMSRKHEQ